MKLTTTIIWLWINKPVCVCVFKGKEKIRTKVIEKERGPEVIYSTWALNGIPKIRRTGLWSGCWWCLVEFSFLVAMMNLTSLDDKNPDSYNSFVSKVLLHTWDDLDSTQILFVLKYIASKA